MKIVRIEGIGQKYDWGKIGDHSLVYQLLKENGSSVDESSPYSELWMGTHPSGHSRIAGTQTLLQDYITGAELPFLFKVLSIRKPLSIQAHPDKNLAIKLHQQFPDIYKDPNHKPELACAVTPFRALCGFRPIKSVAKTLESTEELRNLLGADITQSVYDCSERHEDNSSECKATLKNLITKLSLANESQVAKALENYRKRIESIDPDKRTDVDELALDIEKWFPGDIGVFFAFLLNYIKLNPGESIYLGANEPHAYLSGDCVECMACSDNVVRLGLTPKLRDSATLCSMLTYSSGIIRPSSGEPVKRSTLSTNASIVRYPVPVNEFELFHFTIDASNESISKFSFGSHAILIVLDGTGSITQSDLENKIQLKRGSTLFILANTLFDLLACTAPLDIYCCSSN